MPATARCGWGGILLLLSFTGLSAAPVIVPLLDHKLSGTNSAVWCPTLQMAWTGLMSVVGGPVQMENADPLVAKLNAATCPHDTVPGDACVAAAGFVSQGIVPAIEQALRARFGAEAPALPAIFRDPDIVAVAYAHLQRRLPFERRFVRGTRTPLKFGSKNAAADVAFFGAPTDVAEAYAAQVRVLHYAGPDDYAICLRSKVADECIVLSMMAPPATLREGVEDVRAHLAAKDPGQVELQVKGKTVWYATTLVAGDLLAIPVVNLRAATTFPKLCGRKLHNKGFETLSLGQVYQDVDVSLDESGAAVRSTAYGVAFGGEVAPRRFVFDRPFLLTLWRQKAAQPYLAVWVASADVLVPFKLNTEN